ncbi:hypothetical protein C499_15430 [Halogeometricum borinquense DSM 11551]|uniref:Uncharacterized protein n=1 Tax=Halogeometricum borinquense (strain ATCC 700274 / DSM 11551 / JCM 10706 / KCTC 4070 / PR3) TaxID=469382 RepID=E4NT57_HALBP|nr:hypothetical protein Hbor_26010 [Halogeometricum borinquense DSM 11551]ELY24802.1 hypothetical protein C499_15430 [Halogeometricum borinquense DSM 11551]
MWSPTRTEGDESTRRTVNRRAVLKSVGATGLGAVGLRAATGTAAAGETPDQLYFCGCSQVVATGLARTSPLTVYLRATNEGGCRTRTVETPDCKVGGDREHAFRYTVEAGEAILAVESPDGNVWCNPNQCAQKWLDELTCFESIEGTLRDACTHPSNLDAPRDMFTNRCGTVCSDSNNGNRSKRKRRKKRKRKENGRSEKRKRRRKEEKERRKRKEKRKRERKQPHR